MTPPGGQPFRGYAAAAHRIPFFFAREGRVLHSLHNRIRIKKQGEHWLYELLATSSGTTKVLHPALRGRYFSNEIVPPEAGRFVLHYLSSFILCSTYLARTLPSR